VERHTEGIPTYIVIAADKGLAGGYNHNILNYALDFMTEGDKFVVTIGQEARAFFERKKMPIDVEYLHIAQNPTLYEARNLVNDIAGMYRQGIMSEVYLIYTRYFSNVKQAPVALELLPVELKAFDDVELETDYHTEMNYHPSPEKVFDMLVPQYIIGLVYGALIQAFARENCARMMAMDSASRNADEMTARLNIEMNHARQQSVTREITEIVGAMDAMEKEE
jgi:F-type H+-transporting ATPase subunit gamma